MTRWRSPSACADAGRRGHQERASADVIPWPSGCSPRARPCGALGGRRHWRRADPHPWRLSPAQVLIVEGDVYLQNFEGHPSAGRRARERITGREHDATISYAAHAALLKDPTPARRKSARWSRAHLGRHGRERCSCRLFATSPQVTALVGRPAARRTAVALPAGSHCELDGELHNRPDRVSIPLTGILELLDLTRAGASA